MPAISHQLPWHVGTNGCTPESGGEPAFPCIHDASGRPHGEDIVAQCFGDSATVKGKAEFIVRACNAHDQLVAGLTILKDLAEQGGNDGLHADWSKEIESAGKALAAAKGQQ